MENGTLLGSVEAHQRTISSVAVTPDGRWLIVGSYDATLSFGISIRAKKFVS